MTASPSLPARAILLEAADMEPKDPPIDVLVAPLAALAEATRELRALVQTEVLRRRIEDHERRISALERELPRRL